MAMTPYSGPKWPGLASSPGVVPPSQIRTPSRMVNGLNSPAIRAPVEVDVMPPSAWISSMDTIQVRKQEIATIPVAYARRPVREARTRPIAAMSTAHISPTPRPGISALVSAQTADPLLADAIVPPYRMSSGTSISSRSAAVSAMYLASG